MHENGKGLDCKCTFGTLWDTVNWLGRGRFRIDMYQLEKKKTHLLIHFTFQMVNPLFSRSTELFGKVSFKY